MPHVNFAMCSPTRAESKVGDVFSSTETNNVVDTLKVILNCVLDNRNIEDNDWRGFAFDSWSS